MEEPIQEALSRHPACAATAVAYTGSHSDDGEASESDVSV